MDRRTVRIDPRGSINPQERAAECRGALSKEGSRVRNKGGDRCGGAAWRRATDRLKHSGSFHSLFVLLVALLKVCRMPFLYVVYDELS